MKLYVAGPMTGLPAYNLPAFEAAAADLDAAGYAAVNPGRRGVIEGHTWQDYMRSGLRDLLDCEGIALLPGWATSRGAQLEVHVARTLNLPVQPLDVWLDSAVAR